MKDAFDSAIEMLRAYDYETWIQGSRFFRVAKFDTDTIPRLIAALNDEHPRVRADIAFKLGQMRAVQAVEALRLRLRDFPDASYEPVASNAAQSLGAIGGDRALEILIEALDEPRISHDAAAALVHMKDKRAFLPLLKYFEEHPDSSVATALGNIGDVRATAALMAMLQRQPEEFRFRVSVRSLRYYSVRALGKIGDDRALALLEHIRDTDTEPHVKGKSVADMAAKAIDRINERLQSKDADELPMQ